MKLHRLIPLTAALAALAVTPSLASADTLLAPAPQGAQNLTAAGGYIAWAQPNQPAGSGFRIAVRTPSGTVSTLDVPVFEQAPTPSIGAAGFGNPRPLLLTYSRDGDIFEYDLKAGTERKVGGGVSTGAVEQSPQVVYGRYTFVRATGPQKGIYATTRGGKPFRIAAVTPRELAQNGSRVAYPQGNSIVIRRISNEGEPFVIPTPGAPEGLVVSRYAAAWLVGDRVFRTPRFGGSGPKRDVNSADRGTRAVEGNSIAMRAGKVTYLLDAEGVKRMDPTPFGSRG